MANKIPEIENRLIINKREMETLQESLTDFTNLINKVKTDLNSVKQTISTDLKNNINNLSTEIKEVQDRINKFEENISSEVRGTKSELDNLVEKVSNLSEKIDNVIETLNDSNNIFGKVLGIKENLDKFTKAIEGLDLEQLKNITNNLIKFKNDFDAKFEEVKTELDNAKKRNKIQFVIIIVLILGLIATFFIGNFFSEGGNQETTIDTLKETTTKDSRPLEIYTKEQQKQIDSVEDKILELKTSKKQIDKIDKIKKLFVENAQILPIYNTNKKTIVSIETALANLKALTIDSVNLSDITYKDKKIENATISVFYDEKQND